MSDADASIKSIFSGYTGGEREPGDGFAVPRSPSQNQATLEHEKAPGISSQLDGRRAQGSPNANLGTRPFHSASNSRMVSENSSRIISDNSPRMVSESSSISSRTSPRPTGDVRLHPRVNDFYDGKNNSTNISLISTSSEYQHGIMSDYSESEMQEGYSNEPHSRPLSRNSVTSCLSTTATKDGVEGKRISKPQIKLFDNKFLSLQSAVSSPGQGGPGVSPSDMHSKLRTELDSMALPPISLSEKMEMMNDAAASSNGQANE